MQILVLGMHRSGTSVIARLLNLFGVYFAPEGYAMKPQPDNPRGFWERNDVVELNDEILATAGGSTWDVLGRFDLNSISDASRAQLRNHISVLLHGIDANRPWFIKDPRMCLTLPLWRTELEVPLGLFVFRHPMAVAASLARRNKFSCETGMALWEFYVVHGLRNVGQMPVVGVDFDQFSVQPERSAGWLKEQLQPYTGILRQPLSGELRAYFDTSLLHHGGARSAMELPEHIGQLWCQLRENLQSLIRQPPALSHESHQLLAAHTRQSILEQKLPLIAASRKTRDELLQEMQERYANLVMRHDEEIQRIRRNREALELANHQEKKRLIDQLEKARQVERDTQQALKSLRDKHRRTERQLERHQKILKRIRVVLSGFDKSFPGVLVRGFLLVYRYLRLKPRSLSALGEIKLLAGMPTKQELREARRNSGLLRQAGRKVSLAWKILVYVVRHPVNTTRLLRWENVRYLKKLMFDLGTDQASRLVGQRLDALADTRVLYKPHIIAGESVKTVSLPLCDAPIVSIIVPVYNEYETTMSCLKSIEQHAGIIPYEVILADDCSGDETRAIQSAVANLRVVRQENNVGFLYNCNIASRYARGKYILLLNNDTNVQPEWLQRLLDIFEREKNVGMVGPMLLFPDGVLQEAGGIIWRDASGWNYGKRGNAAAPEFNYVRDVDYVSGACIMLPASLWRDLGMFDERYAPAYYEDTDLAFKVREAGLRVVYQPASKVVHFEGVSHGTDERSGVKKHQLINQKTFRERWARVLEEQHQQKGENVFLAREHCKPVRTVVVIDHYVPQFDRDAGSRSTFQYLKLFRQMNFRVIFIGDNYYRHEPYTTSLQQMGVLVLYGSWYAQNWRIWFNENARYIDVVYMHRPHITEKYVDFLRTLNPCPRLIYFGHDLHYLRLQREREVNHSVKRLDIAKWHRKEFAIFRKVDISYYPSQFEVDTILREAPALKVKAIPLNVVDDLEPMEDDFAQRDGLLFVGGFNHPPNEDAMKWFIADVLPLVRRDIPDICLRIVGSLLPDFIARLSGEHVKCFDSVSDEELAAIYRRTRLSVVPLRFGAGVKGKVIESARLAVPCITTSIGAEGLPEAGSFLAIADNAHAFAAEVVRLYTDQPAWARQRAAGQQVVRRYFSTAAVMEIISQDFLD